MHEDDRHLAKQMAAGRDPAFRTFFDRYFPRVHRFCLRRLPESAAEEVTQSVLINAIRHIHGYRGEASLFTWLCQIARNEISAHYRHNAREANHVPLDNLDAVRAELESLSADPALITAPFTDSLEAQQAVQLVLDHLPGDYGRVLEWKYMDGHSVEDIATRLATTQIAVQSMLARARRAFREQYTALSSLATGSGTQGIAP